LDINTDGLSVLAATLTVITVQHTYHNRGFCGCNYWSLESNLWLWEVHDFSGQVQKFSGEVQNDATYKFIVESWL
jgi:hypothetical protein